ncbi:hypothetical protein [Mucilaginibacter endophyticus]|uniref:hypothetical protein n=1 Tax=Mucilaginibacter endophyticus TaxID=2675003 RepID=UPI0012B16C73|nr:hypothetical protein [Mucilaginibacter endophyticus]
MEEPYKGILLAWAAFLTAFAIVAIMIIIFIKPEFGPLPPGGEPIPCLDPGR